MPLEGVYFFFFLGLVVLFAACFNYVNLSFAKSLNRFKEIGIRKVVGAKRRQLFFQFIIESIIVAFISFILAVVILQILSIFFLNLWINEFIVFDFAQDAWLYLMFIVFAIAVGVLAGIFPALFLSKLTPIKTLENFSANIGKSKKLTLRKFLVVLQFSVSLFLIISTILIYFQLNHLLKAEYGFDQNNIVNVKLQGLDYETLSNEFSRNPSIETISASSFVPGTGISYQTVVKNPDMIDRDIETYYISVNQEFIPNLDIKIKAGSNFPKAGSKKDLKLLVWLRIFILNC